MLMCSESIAHLAGALAKAQVALTNPVKSCTAVLERGRGAGGGETYRYAPLSAGLEIVRKVLGQHEIAVIQATEVDRESGTVLLTTTLAHGSGEWIAAKWPVCQVADVAQPKVMGAALTYARRYSLFALVGLAGEDDLDGVDLAPEQVGADQEQVVDLSSARGRRPLPSSSGRHRRAGAPRRSAARGWAGTPAAVSEREPDLVDPSTALARVTDEAGLLRWAVGALPYRNALSDDARAELDAAFLAQAQTIEADPDLLTAFSGSRDEVQGQTTAALSNGGSYDAQATA